MMQLAQIHPGFFAMLGVLIVTNLGTVGALIVFIFKCGVFVSETKSGIKDAKETGVRAHLRIDNITKIVGG